MSATIASLTADLITITKRADLVADMSLHIKNALIKAHSADYWIKDLFETNFIFSGSAVQYALDYKSLIPRWRTIKYLNTVDPITGSFVRTLKPIPAAQFLDGYGYLQDYRYYLAGSNLQIRVSGMETNFGVGCYLYPDTTLTTPSWIADEFPFTIIYEAARTLFKIMGKDSESSSMEKLVAEAMTEVRMVGLTTQGE